MNNNQIKCLVVDDEPLATRVLEKHIANIDHLEVEAIVHNAIDAFNVLNQKQIDLMFLDIKMPKISGLEFIKSLKNPPKIILTTAFREFALDGFELEVMDYLLKPISFERFLKAISKYPEGKTEISPSLQSPTEITKEFIFVREDKRMKKVRFDDILFIESIKDYVKIITESESILTYIKISYLEENLPKEFLRTHKSFMINSNKIDAYSASEVEISDTSIPIGRYYKQSVQQFLNELSL